MADSPAPPAIDLEHLARYSGGDAALEAEVFALFRQQLDIWLRLLKPDGDAEEWAAAAHALKGSARSIGARDLAAACEAAEAVRAAGAAQRAVAAEEVRRCADAALGFLDRHTYKARLAGLRSASQRDNS